MLTAQVIDRDGFLHTGDLAFVDEDGYVHLTGRLKELIIRGGENIAPGEVEGVIIQSRKVAGVKVLGVSDPHYGEEVCACVSPAEGAELTQEEIKEMVRENRTCQYLEKWHRRQACLCRVPSLSPEKCALRIRILILQELH